MTENIPQEYLLWLESQNGTEEEIQVLLDDREWRILTEKKLQENVSVDGMVSKAFQQLKSFAATLREVFDSDETSDQDGKSFSLERLENCIAIGEDNGNVLFIDPSDDYSVWCFYQAGGDVERLCDSYHTLKIM